MTSRLIAIAVMLCVLAGGWVAAFVIYRAAEIGELVAPIEPRSWDRLTLVAVGTGGSYENPERLGPCLGVGAGGRVVLVDAGRGVAEALRRSRIPVTQPDTVLLTSLLPLDTVGLDDLLYTGWLQERTTPLRVIGPRGTARLVEGLQAAHSLGGDALASALALPPDGGRIEAVEIDEGWSEDRGGLRISAAALSGGPLPGLAYRFEWRARSLVIGGSGWGSERLIELARNADMLVHEAVYIPPSEDLEEAGVLADPARLEREAGLHTALQDVGGLARRAGVRSLVLVRLRPPPFFTMQVSSIVGRSYSGQIRIPEDGAELVP